MSNSLFIKRKAKDIPMGFTTSISYNIAL